MVTMPLWNRTLFFYDSSLLGSLPLLVTWFTFPFWVMDLWKYGVTLSLSPQARISYLSFFLSLKKEHWWLVRDNAPNYLFLLSLFLSIWAKACMYVNIIWENITHHTTFFTLSLLSRYRSTYLYSIFYIISYTMWLRLKVLARETLEIAPTHIG